jgi:hypothetical protein
MRDPGRFTMRNLTPVEFERWAAMRVRRSDIAYFRTAADANAAIKVIDKDAIVGNMEVVMENVSYGVEWRNGKWHYVRVYRIEDRAGMVTRAAFGL